MIKHIKATLPENTFKACPVLEYLVSTWIFWTAKTKITCTRMVGREKHGKGKEKLLIQNIPHGMAWACTAVSGTGSLVFIVSQDRLKAGEHRRGEGGKVVKKTQPLRSGIWRLGTAASLLGLLVCQILCTVGIYGERGDRCQ